jgi:flagellar basal body-associated protein FliL
MRKIIIIILIVVVIGVGFYIVEYVKAKNEANKPPCGLECGDGAFSNY